MRLSELLLRSAMLERSQRAKKEKREKRGKRICRGRSANGLVWIPNKIRKKFAGAER